VEFAAEKADGAEQSWVESGQHDGHSEHKKFGGKFLLAQLYFLFLQSPFLQEEEQNKITTYFTSTQAAREEEKAAEDDLLLEDLDWDAIDAEAARQT